MKKKILVIEDDNILQNAIKIGLEDAGFNVLQALDGKKGCEMAKQEQPDLILLDMVLPKEDGVTILKHIRKDKSTEDVPVLVFTLYQDQRMLEKCVEIGVQGYFFKVSYSIEEIIKEIKKKL